MEQLKPMATRRTGLLAAAGLWAGLIMAPAILVSCGKKADTAAIPPGINSNSVPETAATDNPGIRNATPANVQPVTLAPATDPSAILAQLTQVLRRFSVEHRRVPQSLSELTSAGYLSALPTPPAGRQFVIDQKQVQVVLQSR